MSTASCVGSSDAGFSKTLMIARHWASTRGNGAAFVSGPTNARVDEGDNRSVIGRYAWPAEIYDNPSYRERAEEEDKMAESLTFPSAIHVKVLVGRDTEELCSARSG